MNLRANIFRACAPLLSVGLAGTLAYAQQSETQFLPEVDAHYEIKSNARLYFQAKDDRDGGDPPQATIGPSVLIYRKPLVKLKHVLVFDLDASKSRPIVFESGYRVIMAPDAAVTNRLVEAVTFHYPLQDWFLISDRNRADLDWQGGAFTWRYRNKLTIERMLAIGSFHFAPYLAAEPFYESQYGKWASTDLYAGSGFPIGKHVECDPYYEHENDTGKKPNTQNNYIGVQLQLYFARRNVQSR